jgi:hypothetical protein
MSKRRTQSLWPDLTDESVEQPEQRRSTRAQRPAVAAQDAPKATVRPAVDEYAWVVGLLHRGEDEATRARQAMEFVDALDQLRRSIAEVNALNRQLAEWISDRTRGAAIYPSDPFHNRMN